VQAGKWQWMGDCCEPAGFWFWLRLGGEDGGLGGAWLMVRGVRALYTGAPGGNVETD
jgi:hypothetical protein